MSSIAVVYGTRPEGIKLAPVIGRLRAAAHEVRIVSTGQHREMLDQVNELFDLRVDHDLELQQPGQTLGEITGRALTGLLPLLEDIRPDLVLVQGDTTSSFAASLAASYLQIPVAHLEAGLRTGNRYSPFPEEINRRLTTQLASIHLTPTQDSRDNLLREGLDPSTVFVTGNTVIDALQDTLAAKGAQLEGLAEISARPGRPIVLVTVHRRESWGEGMHRIGRALARLAVECPEVLIVVPIHKNPVVREAVLPVLEGHANILVLEPLSYLSFARLLVSAHLVLTDSGGIQEEAPSLDTPVLVLRESTERPEAVLAGAARLVGTDEDIIVAAARELLENPAAYRRMAQAPSPFGDGRAAERTVRIIEHYLDGAERPPDWDYAQDLLSARR